MIEILISAAPNQTLTTTQANQQCRINLYTQMDGKMYFDLIVAGIPIVQYVICQNLRPLVDGIYRGFIGDFYFVDTQGGNDPAYDGLGVRYKLYYMSSSEAALIKT